MVFGATAKPLASVSGRRSVVLIHDDADNCQQNVCAAAEVLRRSGLVAHVVGLGLKPEDATRMACLPQITGGRFSSGRVPADHRLPVGLAMAATGVLGGARPLIGEPYGADMAMFITIGHTPTVILSDAPTMD